MRTTNTTTTTKARHIDALTYHKEDYKMSIKQLIALLAQFDENANVLLADDTGRFYSLAEALTLSDHCKQYGCPEYGAEIYEEFTADIDPVIIDLI